MPNTVTQTIEIPKGKQDTASAILKQVENLIAEAEPEDLARIKESLEPKVISREKRELAKRIADKDYVEPNPSRLLELQLANLQRIYQRRRELLANAITSTKVAELLGCENRSTVRDRRLAGTILGLKDKGVYKYPIWQFDPEGDDGILDGFPQVLAALDVPDFVKLNWLNKPHRAFEQKTPIEMLKQREIEKVIVEARAVGIGW